MRTWVYPALLLGLTAAGGCATKEAGSHAGRYAAGTKAAAATGMTPPGAPQEAEVPFNTETYDRIVDNDFIRARQQPLSTFAVDVDTASYANVRRFLNQDMLPPKDAVRIEELVNYFPYDYAPPTGERPFAVHAEVAGCPWNPEHRLARIALKGKEIPSRSAPSSNLVFLIDVSGSMNEPNKLPLVKAGLRLLVGKLNKENDWVAIVVYAGTSGLVLPSTPCSQKEEILSALDRLEAGGSTNGGQGIQLAYQTALTHFIPGGANRVILCTDGDFNVGITNQGDLTRLIEDKARSGVFLSVLGFGMGNFKDSTMEKLADRGNGNYAYIDTLQEASKVLVEQMSGTLVTIAKDVKVQVDFNPGKVYAYRLIGYENRLPRAEDFRDDAKDAGEIGAGHTVTALYEIVPAGKKIDLPEVDPSKYQKPGELTPAADSGQTFTVKLAYKDPEGSQSQYINESVTDQGKALNQASADFKFAAAVASFGMLLRESRYKGNATFADVLEGAREGKGADPWGYRTEFLGLVQKAQQLSRN